MENYIKIEVKDAYESWYTNALIENDYDAFRVAKFYRDELGYLVRVIKDGQDITSLLDSMKIVRIRKD